MQATDTPKRPGPRWWRVIAIALVVALVGLSRQPLPGFSAAIGALGVLFGLGGWAIHKGAMGPSVRGDVLLGASAGCLVCAVVRLLS